MTRRQRILYLVTEDWYFASHRLPMARAARDAGFEVHVATQVGSHGDAVRREGFVLHPLTWHRGRVAPRSILSVAARLRRLYGRIQPDLVHAVGVQPSVVGSLAGLGLPIASLNALAGMGYAFTSRTPRARATRSVLTPLMRQLFGRPGASVLVQNPDDEAAMISMGVSPAAIHRIPGSGVDVERFAPLPEPDGLVRCGYVGRLLEDKGVRTLVEAHELLASRGRPVTVAIAGEPDPANPASFSADELARWQSRPGLELLGHVADVRDIWRASHVAVLASRREGLPLSLLEAAACGRPIIATDVPGCREVARAGSNALLVPVDDAPALAEAIARLAGDPQLRARFGAESRRLVVSTFSSVRIGEAVVTLYRDLIDRSPWRKLH